MGGMTAQASKPTNHFSSPVFLWPVGAVSFTLMGC